MAGASLPISVVVVEDQDIQGALQRLLRATGNLRPAFRDMGEYLLRAERERFAAQRAPDGQSWAPLSPAYVARKKKHRGLKLVLDGFLRDLMRYQVSATAIEFGTDRVYGATHQFGAPERGIPPRPFLGLSAEDGVQILDIVADHLSR